METNQIFSETLSSEENSLAHYGVKGMKWGVWNAETAARYAHVARRKIGDARARSKEKAKARNAVRVEKRAASKKRREETKTQRKELGMDPVKYSKLRKQTLKSHNPSTVAKGMHTLTDEELSAKIKRLQQEDIVFRMAQSRAQEAHRTEQARRNAVSANPVVKFADKQLDKLSSRILDTVLPKPQKNKKKDNKKDNKPEPGKDKDNNKDKSKGKGKDKPVEGEIIDIQDIPVYISQDRQLPSGVAKKKVKRVKKVRM